MPDELKQRLQQVWRNVNQSIIVNVIDKLVSSCMHAGEWQTLRAYAVENNMSISSQLYDNINVSFLADRTNGRAIATLLRLSSVVVCDVMYCG